MIRSAQKNIRIIQPYVQNIDELEDLLIEAIEKRGVNVEIITARNRD
jgi:phosphatidylserine/phosphatidylglycerophosphate/cardiolipin synthase-like enzyme